VLHESSQTEGVKGSLDARAARLEKDIQNATLSDDLRKSFSSQLEILQQRISKQQEARAKLAFLEAELTRIQEQVELIREQAVLSADPEAVSQRIDQIAATLGGTTQWIHEQQRIYGKVEDLLAEGPPVMLDMPAKESQ
jgi:chromosome segregation ATPase